MQKKVRRKITKKDALARIEMHSTKMNRYNARIKNLMYLLSTFNEDMINETHETAHITPIVFLP